MITIHLKVSGEDAAEHLCDYDSAKHALEDLGLKALFDSALVDDCTIHQGGKRLAGLPFMTWEKFKAALELHDG